MRVCVCVCVHVRAWVCACVYHLCDDAVNAMLASERIFALLHNLQGPSLCGERGEGWRWREEMERGEGEGRREKRERGEGERERGERERGKREEYIVLTLEAYLETRPNVVDTQNYHYMYFGGAA